MAEDLPEDPVAAITITWRRGEPRFVCDLRGVDRFAARRMLESALESMELVLPDCDLRFDDGFISVSGVGPEGDMVEGAVPSYQKNDDDEDGEDEPPWQSA